MHSTYAPAWTKLSQPMHRRDQIISSGQQWKIKSMSKSQAHSNTQSLSSFGHEAKPLSI